jgi:hypothetical protein
MSLLEVDIELMKNLSAAAKYGPKDGCEPRPSIPTTAVGLLHPLCIGSSNNPSLCYCSSIDHLDSSSVRKGGLLCVLDDPFFVLRSTYPYPFLSVKGLQIRPSQS